MSRRIAIILIGILVVLLGRGFFYYRGFHIAPSVEMPSFERVVAPLEPSTEYSDIYEKGEGKILFDIAHDNAVGVGELSVLVSRLISRGLTIDFFAARDDLEKELLGKQGGKGGEEEGLKEKPPVAYIIVCPQAEFSKEERETINTFVNDRGKLLLIADPTRAGEMNSISLEFGLIFEPDYLYNVKENDANFRNIFITEFKKNEITKDLEKIALYTAGSITSADVTYSIALVDQNTFSSVIETRRGLSPIALAKESKVLAIYDLTFMTEPYNGVLDNNQLISNIADWLASPAEVPAA